MTRMSFCLLLVMCATTLRQLLNRLSKFLSQKQSQARNQARRTRHPKQDVPKSKLVLTRARAGRPEDRGESSRFFRAGPREDKALFS